MILKEKLNERALSYGSWLTIGDLSVTEIMAKTGFDWLAIDMEHTAITIAQAQAMIAVIELNKVAPLVRVGENSAYLIKRVMDAGAHGVIVPMVNSKADAEKAVAAVKYPPVGTRGVGLSRAQKYSLDLESYRQWNQESSIVIVQLEHYKAVENIEEIMSVKGVDGFIIGLYDLSGSLGCPGEFDNPKVVRALNDILNKSKEKGYLMGFHVVDPASKVVIDKIEQGFKFIAVGTDFIFLSQSCNRCLSNIRAGLIKD
ncbi:MAG: aldolase/citrate lyase family protein [bacterium]